MDVEAAAQAVSTAGLSVVVGYCWGGTIAWMAACHSPLFTAASCWYGGGIGKAKEDQPNIPGQMPYGMQDQSLPDGENQAISQAHTNVKIHQHRRDSGRGRVVSEGK